MVLTDHPDDGCVGWVDAGGHASFSTSGLAVGTHNITATFGSASGWQTSNASVQQNVQDRCATSADALFEPHLPKLALFCLRFTKDPEKAAALAERVLLAARRKIASSNGAQSFSGWLYSILREECATPLRARSAPSTVQPLRAAEEVP